MTFGSIECIPPAEPVPRMCGAAGAPLATEVSWHQHLSVADRQREGSCVGRAFASAIEISIHAGTGERVQIDAYRLWARARSTYYGNLHGGLTLGQCLSVCLMDGLLPKLGADRVPLSRAELCAALHRGPLVQAHSTHAGWERLHPDNGCIDESVAFRLGQWCHATAGIAWDIHNGVELIAGYNSWGQEYGKRGVFAMTVEHYLASAVDEPILIDVPGQWWQKSREWRGYVTGSGTQPAKR